MSSYYCNNNWRTRGGIWQYWLIMILVLDPAHSQKFLNSRIVFASSGTQFSPMNTPAQLLSTKSTASLKMCAIACNSNVLCRIFDFGVNLPQQCRLFEGDATTMGAIISSPSVNSTVGIVQLSVDLFVGHGLSCPSVCQQSRYLTCSSSICQCMPHTYWNGSICVAQTLVLGAPCQQNMGMCREDFSYTCLQFNQCGPLSVLSGTTIADQNIPIVGSMSPGLTFPLGIIADIPVPGYILVADGTKNQVVRLSTYNHSINNNSVVARNWPSGDQFYHSYDIFVDTTRGNNLYVSDTGNNRVMMFAATQSVAPLPTIIAGTGLNFTGPQVNAPRGIVIDRHGNTIVVDYGNNRVLLYAPNSTNSTIIVGLNTPGSDSQSLYNPVGLFLDDLNRLLYIADASNHRIQRFSLNKSFPLNGTTVAGGNGVGPGSAQLNQPFGVWVSNKTGAIYIADTYNNRIQRWSQGATTSVTIAGDPSGTAGTNATMLKAPCRLTANTNETLLYVSDANNARVQLFQLI